ncbi:hypothetical protein SEA_MULCH_43 [Gordonia phage Mulch]|uniref:Uncharacterized protein n=5 Tax=Betterkatzvirus betterkatz TaxID=2560485 RepID=A0A7T0M0P7_9CAUD|nr:hypothetical protein PBI_WHEATTHIN_43 [Gordonia phage WheatThin]QAU06841.1 hypothetical protein SEA_BRYLIE_43 [Gordonia phage Brylie]QAX92539.1 hypothetical protein SEA_MULCH_43 [Gordonia phage Mulch]QAY06500.1 hypothetical protein SEA_PARADA_43 [Gordonia phage Parada]QPL13918.1 hypothetical protein SEA_NANCYRAE_43 [Gordonia phage NancyRae]
MNGAVFVPAVILAVVLVFVVREVFRGTPPVTPRTAPASPTRDTYLQIRNGRAVERDL